MTKKDKELLFKDLSARLPYGVKVEIKYYDDAWELLAIYTNGTTYASRDVGYPIETYFEDCKPYLFPLSSITIEQEKELSKLGVSYGEYALHDDTRGLGIYVDEAYIFFEFCYKHHIDFLGLIEKGLALDATGLGIYENR
jgi:hypothetical protein